MIKKLLFIALPVLFCLNAFSQGAPACPNVTTGSTQTICNGNCATLTSTLVTNNATTSYSVSSIPYAPYSFTTGTPILVNTDDLWSPVQNLLFNFCFFGNTYNQCVVGANGHVTFDLSYANAYDAWPCNTALPSTANMPGNTINAVFRDIDPSVTGSGAQIYYDVGGTAPCRYVTISWYHVPLFSCNSTICTFQLVLYENTNYIDVYIQSSAGTCSWNSGNGIVGIQNAAATTAVCPAGRNNTNFTATNEAWRFTPTGSPSYTFKWIGPGNVTVGTTQTLTVCPTTTTTYTASMTVTNCDGTSFTKTNTQQVIVNPGPTISVNSPTICPGNSTTLTASGATTYNWSPGTGLSGTTGTSVTANPASTTVYTVSGTTSGCTGTTTSTVTVSSPPTVTATSATVCPGSSTTLTASGANTYTWSPGTGLSGTTGASVTCTPGSSTVYTVTGTSVAGCTATATSSVTIGSAITPSVNSATICIGSSATLNASGGSTYTWSPGTGLSGTSGSSVTANPTATTVYTITAASGGCMGTTTATVTVNPLPTVTASSGTICPGNSTTLNASGASNYTWSPGTGLSGTTGASVTANPGSTTSYTITGTDANGCVNTGTTSVIVSPLPTVTATSATICPGSSGTITASGASTYTWSTGATGASLTQSPGVTTTYTVTGASAAGCTNTATASITVGSSLVVSVNSATICAGSPATLNATGASSYTWSPATGLSGTSGASVTANPPTTTTYTILGSTGTCTASATSTVQVNPLPVVTSGSASICMGQQTATLTANGASTYSWSPGTGLSGTTGSSVTANPSSTTTYTITGTDANGCMNTSTTTVTVNPLPVISVNSATICPTFSATLTASGASTYTWNTGGTGSSMTDSPASTTSYSVAGTDANGCISFNTATITVNPTLLVSASNNSAICAGSALNLSASTGVIWSWTGPGGFTSSSQNPVLSPATTAMSGTYSVTATDANGCQGSAVTTVTVNPLPSITVGSNSPVCVNQAVNLTSTGGPGYAWSGPSSFTSTQQNPTISGATTANGGIYTLTVTDANSCVSTGTVNVVVNPLPVISVTGATVCLGATINLTASGGVSYSWSGPNSYNSNQQNPSISNAAINMSGNYVVTVTDNNGCVNANIAQVTVNPALVISASNNGPLCVNATLNLNASTGVSWSWSGPGGFASFSQNPSIPNIQPGNAGTYIVTGTDQNGCSGTDSTTVVVNPLPVISVNSDTICAGQQSTTLIANGGITYSWSPSSGLSNTNGSTVVANPMVSMTYVVTGTDGNGCSNTANATVSVNQPPTVTATSATLCLGNSGTLTASGAATYTWSPATGLNQNTGNSVTSSPSATTSYTVIGTDNNGCFNSGVCTVVVNPLPVFTVSSGTVCAGGSATLNANGTNSYSWLPATGLNVTSGPSVAASPSATTTYSVIGTDLNNCSDTMTTLVTVNPLPQVSITPKISSGCSPVCVTTFSNTTSANGTCSWAFSDGTTSSYCTPGHCFSGQGTFYSIMTLTDGNGCKGKDSAKVIVYPIPTSDFNWQPQPASILDPIIGFYNESSGAVINTWKWSFGDPGNHTSLLQNPSFDFENAGTYTTQLLVISNYGCVDSVSKVITIDPDYMIYVPNAFTPNDDGTNETFAAKGEGIDEFRMYIFDRWGNEVFFSDDIFKGWDGRYQAKGNDILPQDMYVWKIELKTYKGEAKMLKGTVSLLK